MYAGHEGAFKCMVDGKGDVAFFKHGTVKKAVNKGIGGNLADYEYLCKEGSRKREILGGNCQYFWEF